jgi:hypothetical protein
VRLDSEKRHDAAFNALRGFSGVALQRKASARPRDVARRCLECGDAFTARRQTAQFCGRSCRQQFHSRKTARASVAIDLLMAWRFDRAAFEAVGGRTLLSQVIAGFRAEDRRERAGRKSWDHPQMAKQRAVRFLSVAVGCNVAGAKRGGTR